MRLVNHPTAPPALATAAVAVPDRPAAPTERLHTFDNSTESTSINSGTIVIILQGISNWLMVMLLNSAPVI